MALSYFPSPRLKAMLEHAQKKQMLELARGSINWGLQHGQVLPVDVVNYDKALTRNGASFVTLHKNKQLRGCIGSLEAYQALVKDVSQNAYSAAFRDPRFEPVQQQELTEIAISISVLTPSQAMTFDSEQDLIKQIKPNIDGLILSEGSARGTFLPSVWQQISEPQQFLQQLKLKAGLPVDYWSRSVKVSRYQTESFYESEI